jgi:FkbM family methyltransferase
MSMRSLVERNDQVRTVVRSEPVQRVLHAVRGSQGVQERATFVRRQLVGRDVGSYHLHNGLRVSVRHGTLDMSIFTRVFWRRIYDPPAALRERLRPPLRVLDLGANIGLFSASLGPGVVVTAVEADHNNVVFLEELIKANGLDWEVIPAYASTENGTIGFASGQWCFSKADPRGQLVDKIDIFPLLADVDLLKMDIEGGEWEVLADPRMTSAPPILVMEWHTMSCPSPDDAKQLACDALTRAGYTHIVVPEEPGLEPDAQWNNGHLWAWR